MPSTARRRIIRGIEPNWSVAVSWVIEAEFRDSKGRFQFTRIRCADPGQRRCCDRAYVDAVDAHKTGQKRAHRTIRIAVPSGHHTDGIWTGGRHGQRFVRGIPLADLDIGDIDSY